jgi:Raf kinase inhibitor-like YbhB/YbcL family protein
MRTENDRRYMRSYPRLWALICGILLCTPALAESPRQTGGAMQLTSTAFTQGQAIPRKHTCDGSDISPPLAWSGAPANAKSFALIMDDPDAPGGTWVHWVIYNIPAADHALPEAVPTSAKLADGAVQGKNSWPKSGYGGPCPPSGTHRYFFKIFALDALLKLPDGATKPQLIAAMEDHVLAQAELMGTYKR